MRSKSQNRLIRFLKQGGQQSEQAQEEARPTTTYLELQEFSMSLKAKYPRPIVAVIGAGIPNRPYEPSMGMKIGYVLAKTLAKSGGSLLVGGMGGIGVDTYVGVSKFRMESGNLIEPPFFVLIPEYEESKWSRYINMPQVPFWEADSYTKLDMLTGATLIRERIGESLIVRRLALAMVADLFIALNGTGGTLEEAATAIRLDKPVIAVRESGGVAQTLADLRISFEEKRSMLNTEDMRYVMASLPPQFNTNLIVAKETVDEAIVTMTEMITKEKTK